MGTITELEVMDIRFPTSRSLDGSDAMNPDPDYSAAYVVLRTDDAGGIEGHGLTFTIGRGTEVVVAAVGALRPLVVGRSTDELFADMGAFWRSLVGDSQLRWIGPEKGAIHLATAAVVNAAWDLFAKSAGKPLWKLLVDMTPAEIVALVDFRYIADALAPDDALAMLTRLAPTREARVAELRRDGYPAYTTSAGWLGYDDAKIRRLCREALADGWTRFKLKVGGDVEDDIRRARIVREEIGPDRMMAVDANQRWNVDEAIAWMARLAPFAPYWIEEPTSPDDILGHATIARAVAPIRVATGEHVHNRVMFKQFLQAGGMGVCQIDACRLGGVNEVLAVLLLAAKFGVPVCPHAGGVGLCELVQHLSIIDYVCISGSLDGRMIEYVDHLHEHFLDPVVIRDGRYRVPERQGYSAEMAAGSLARYAYPGGAAWSEAGTPESVAR
jgi:L-fuconate dehydratase